MVLLHRLDAAETNWTVNKCLRFSASFNLHENNPIKFIFSGYKSDIHQLLHLLPNNPLIKMVQRIQNNIAN